jgi:hypothetical protein
MNKFKYVQVKTLLKIVRISHFPVIRRDTSGLRTAVFVERLATQPKPKQLVPVGLVPVQDVLQLGVQHLSLPVNLQPHVHVAPEVVHLEEITDSVVRERIHRCRRQKIRRCREQLYTVAVLAVLLRTDDVFYVAGWLEEEGWPKGVHVDVVHGQHGAGYEEDDGQAGHQPVGPGGRGHPPLGGYCLLEAIVLWRLLSFGAYCPIEPIVLWSLLSFGAYCPLEPIVLWSLLFFGGYCPLEPIVLWRLLSFGAYCPLEPIVLWSLLSFGGYCPLEPASVKTIVIGIWPLLTRLSFVNKAVD